MPIRRLMIKFAILLQVFVATWIFSPPALSASFLLTPVESLALKGDSPIVTFDLPCGGEQVGAMVRTNISKDTLFIAMVVRVNKIRCTALPTRVSALLTYVSSNGFKKVEPLKIGDPVRISPIVVSGLRVGKSGSTIEAVFENGCSKLAGTILRGTGESVIEIAMAEASGASSSAASTAGKNCVSGAITATVPGVAVVAGRKFRPYETTPADIERAFFVRLAEIKPGSLVRRASGIEVTFQRKCNEAPIGVVIDGKTTKGRLPSSIDMRNLRVGVLVAKYYNVVCPDGSPSIVEDKIANKDINIPKSTEVTFMAPTRNASTLGLREPSQYAMIQNKTGRGIAIDFKTGCDKQLGAVYARDDKGNIAVAVLERQGDPFQCKAGRDLTMVQPFAGKGPGAMAVYPLKIRRDTDKNM